SLLHDGRPPRSSRGGRVRDEVSFGRDQASSASLQYCTHLAISFIRSEPSGTGYSNSIVAWIGHLLSRIVCNASLIGVSPWPKGTFLSPSVLSFTCMCVMRSWCCLRNGIGDVFCPLRKWPMSRLAPLYFE